MSTVFQIICVAFIVAAIVIFVRNNSRQRIRASKRQMAMGVFQIIICGWFFALCLSDVLDIKVNFSYERFTVNCFYAIAFLAITVYTLFNKYKWGDQYFKGVIWAFIVLIGVQCFVYPYGTESEVMRVVEAVEGAVVFGLLISLLFKLKDARYGMRVLVIAVILEIFIAVENAIMPFASITDDFQPIDIPLNYAALFMRPILFGSLALSYRVWLDLKRR